MDSSLAIVDPALLELVESSTQRETIVYFLVGVGATVWIIRQVIPLLQWLKGDRKKEDDMDEQCREAVRIITQKDMDGINVFLGIPKMLRGFTDALEAFTVQVRQLVNHQSETILKLNETANETQKLVGIILARFDDAKYQRDFRKQ